MNLVDSSAWLEYFADGPNADFFSPAVEDRVRLLVPTVCLYEVFKKTLEMVSGAQALQHIAAMHQGQVVDLTEGLALAAAKLSRHLGLPMADSIIVATASAHGATIWTQDADLKGVDRVRYRPRRH